MGTLPPALAAYMKKKKMNAHTVSGPHKPGAGPTKGGTGFLFGANPPAPARRNKPKVGPHKPGMGPMKSGLAAFTGKNPPKGARANKGTGR